MTRDKPDDPVDRTSAQSFPASDPPGWVGTITGGPSVADTKGPGSPFAADELRARLNERIARHWWAAARGSMAAVGALLSGGALLAFSFRLRARDKGHARARQIKAGSAGSEGG